MWQSLPSSQFGLMNVIDEVVRDVASSMPDLNGSHSLLCASDYSGQHKQSTFEAYSFVIAGSASWSTWEKSRLAIREQRLRTRQMSFKKLNDKTRLRALPSFLNAADQLDGLIAVILVDKQIGSLFGRSRQFDFTAVPEYAAYGAQTFERLLRAAHLLSFFIAGLSRSGQDVFWFTDADDFAANEARIRMLTNIFSNVSSHYLSHQLGHFRCGTSSICDNGTLQIEDLCAIADLAAGATTELLNRHCDEGTIPNSRVIVPASSTLSEKSAYLSGWLSRRSTKLTRLILALEAESGSASIRVKRIMLHNLATVG
ncbi:MAG TPA: hypothetical protein VGQ08_17595 [Nitrospiraceae bacterium]|jgi:hypothetical protein|nr:hypothetical protein [Nitrospiraceae bacterium]